MTYALASTSALKSLSSFSIFFTANENLIADENAFDIVLTFLG